MNYDTAKLRQFINEHFGPQDLNDLLFDYFRSVHEDLTPGMTKRQHISLLLGFCRKHNQMPNLLAAVEKMRPFFQPNDYVQGQQTLTVTPQPSAQINRNPRQIFISHAHQDAEVAQRLAHDLEANGYDIWIAPDSIRPGEKWVEAINRGLEESGIFVLLLSPDAVASRWVQMETNVAISYTHEDEMALYPLMLKTCRLSGLWRAFQYISLREGYDRGFNQLLGELGFRGGKDVVAEIKEEAKTVSKSAPAQQRFIGNPDRWIHPKTGIEMVRVSAGEYFYQYNERLLEEFWIAKTPITNAEYAIFIKDTGYEAPNHWENNTFPTKIADHPVVNVTWHDAKEYADWAGLELPTDEMWEIAAQGTDGRMYPWGEKWQDNHCNTKEARIGSTTPVGQFSPRGDSPWGCVDMSGNVWEWTNSVYYDKNERVIRGSSWKSNARNFARTTYQGHAFRDFGEIDRGFRVVMKRLPT